jgi:hypothetical protein
MDYAEALREYKAMTAAPNVHCNAPTLRDHNTQSI